MIEDVKNPALEQTQSIRTKEAYLREQANAAPKERTGSSFLSAKTPSNQSEGKAPSSLAEEWTAMDALPGRRNAGGKEVPPALPGSDTPTGKLKTRAKTAQFLREKGAAAGRTAGNTAGTVARDAASGGGKALKTMRPAALKEAGKTTGKTVKATGKTVKTAGYVSRKAVKTAGTSSAQMLRNARQAAQSGAKAKAVQEAATRAAKRGAGTLKDAAQTVAAAARAAAAALQSLLAGLTAGGGVILVVIIVILLIGLLIVAPFGIFLSGQTGIGQNVQTALAQLTGEYNARIQEIQVETPHDELDIAEDIVSAMMDNRKNVLAVYAVRVTTDELNATEVVTMTEEKMEVLREVFQYMNQIRWRTTSRRIHHSDEEDEIIVTLHISVTIRDADEAARQYHFDQRGKELLQELLSPEYNELFDALLGSSPTLIPGDLDGVLIPDDVSEARRQVIATGSQLLGQVHYFWGGKSLVLGWDSRWGTPTRVWAAGSPSTGTVRPFGLDCSGYVDWVFYNVSGGTYVIGHGGGASAQHSYCTTIPWSEAQPGDLAFYPGDSHVGIIVGYDESGNVRIMHCASGSNNVVVTGKIGFTVAARPRYYG